MTSEKELVAASESKIGSDEKAKDEDTAPYSFASESKDKRYFPRCNCTSHWNFIWASLFLVNFVLYWICLSMLLQLRTEVRQMQNVSRPQIKQHIESGKIQAFQYQGRQQISINAPTSVKTASNATTEEAVPDKDAKLDLRRFKGEKGNVQSRGLPGQNGTMGMSGVRGGFGPPGTKGSKGEPGEIGPQGRSGFKGEKGGIGPRVLPGRNGTLGMNGLKGESGLPGRNGSSGSKGEPGEMAPHDHHGSKGNKGDVGPRGVPGRNGNKGEKGLGIRLVGGVDEHRGRVEILHDNVWGTICDDGWDNNDGAVICRMLGFSGVTAALSRAYYGQGSGKIWLDDVHCFGSESRINDCSKSSWGSHNCGHSEDASVVCN